jgi:Flp pilus assembly protein TadD
MFYGSAMILRTIPVLTVLAMLTVSAVAAPAKIVKEPPVTVETLLTQAHAAADKGDTELALRLAQSAIVANPARPASYVTLGDIYAEAGLPDYARSYYDAALNIDPVLPSALKAIAALDQSHTSTTAQAEK